MKTAAIIEARMTSTRLPGKVLKLLGEKPMLQLITERAGRAKNLDEIIVATTTNKTDDPIINLCRKIGIKYFRGSENDVMERVIKAGEKNNIDIICELMGDSPFLDPKMIDLTIETHLHSKNDYTSNFYPENHLPMGFAVQVYSTKILKKAAELTNDPIDRVHVTYFIYQHPEIFKCGGIKIAKNINRPKVRLCVDTQLDFDLVSAVYAGIGQTNNDFSCHDIIKYLDSHKELLLINKNVKQKKASEG
jgi:spore coat polysaccharide biosynthesis protein SpsF